MTSKVAWPKTVPVLNGNDFCKGKLVSNSGKTRCLYGWVENVFGEGGEFDTLARTELREVAGASYLATFNDTRPKSELARVWNQAMTNLGYTEDCEDV